MTESSSSTAATIIGTTATGIRPGGMTPVIATFTTSPFSLITIYRQTVSS
jgi:hypothetical protein